jgi:acyl-CoA reductase-like NAD-dependent aldehyde dehydrogenase
MFTERFAQRFEDALGRIMPHHTVTGSSGIGRIARGNQRAGFVGDPSVGRYYHPVVVHGVKPADVIVHTETLGPMVCVMPFSQLDEATTVVNELGFGLLAGIYTGSAHTAFRFTERVDAGIVAVNRPLSQSGEARAPFGGRGQSGNGSRLAGQHALDEFTYWRAMSWSHGPSAPA